MNTMLSVVIQSSVVLLLAFALMPLLRRRSAALRHWVIAGALCCAAAVPIVGRVIPTWTAPIELATLTPRGLLPGAREVMSPPDRATRPGGATSVNPSRQTDTSPSATGLAMAAWAAGTALSLIVLVIGLVRLVRLTRRGTAVVDGSWAAIVGRLARERGLRCAVSIRAVEHPALLLVWGYRRPTLIIPAVAAGWAEDRIAAVVDHELAHVARGDWLTQLIAELVRAVYWFNPLVWMACARLRTECEIACDDTVLASGTDGRRYATHLVATARDLSTRYWVPAPAIVRPSTLERRVRAMLDTSRDRRPVSTRARRLAGALLLTTTVAIAGLAAQTFVSMSGTIVDPSNAVLPGVTLVLTNESSGAKYEIKTDRTGRYEFVGLPAGSYMLDAAMPGFARFSGRVTVGTQNVQQDLALSLGMVEETVTVSDGPLQPPDPERLRQIEERRRQVDDIKRKRAAATCPEMPAIGDVRTGGNIRVPVKYRDVRPIYPQTLSGVEGLVVLNTRIGVDGSVSDVEVVSATHPDFADAAIAAVTQWEFDATLLNCERVTTPMRVTVNFRAQ